MAAKDLAEKTEGIKLDGTYTGKTTVVANAVRRTNKTIGMAIPGDLDFIMVFSFVEFGLNVCPS